MTNLPTTAQEGEDLRFVSVPRWLALSPLVVVPLAFGLDNPAVWVSAVVVVVLAAAVLLRRVVVIGQTGIAVLRAVGMRRSPGPIAWDAVKAVPWASTNGPEIVAVLSEAKAPIPITRVRRRLRGAGNARAIDHVIRQIANAAPAEQGHKVVTVESQRRPTESVAATLLARGADGTLFAGRDQ